MTKVHLLGANKSYDRSVQTVSVNQVVVLEGYSYDSYVVYEVTRDKWGITYHLVNLRTHEFHTSDLIRPLSEKFGIGIYYDDANPRFLDPLETAALLTKAKEKKAEEEKKAKEGMAMIFSSKAGIFAMISSGMYRLPVLGYETSFFSYRDWAMERVLSAVRSWWMLQSF